MDRFIFVLIFAAILLSFAQKELFELLIYAVVLMETVLLLIKAMKGGWLSKVFIKIKPKI